LFRFLVAAALIGSLLAFAKERHIVNRAGIVGSCAALTASAPLDRQWWECRPGRLTGYPDLSNDGCNRGIMRGEVRYWLCPTALAARASDESLDR
jgi:hypothetical protein